MDKSWIALDRRSKEYMVGVENFLAFSLSHAVDQNGIRCPCLKCGNLNNITSDEIRDHLFIYGMDQSYIKWIWHGESVHPTLDSPIQHSPNIKRYDGDFIDNMAEMVQDAHTDCTNDPDQFQKLLEDAEKSLYPSCTKFTKLSALVRLYKLKADYGISNTCFSELLQLLGDMLPTGNELPMSMYEAKKTLNALGLEYHKFDACPNDCLLYRKDYQDATTCPVCGLSRWKVAKNSNEIKEGVPAKVLWYFPPIPRFKRMFRNSEISKNLIWHAKEKHFDGIMRHPSDSPAWKVIDYMWPGFSADSRNLRLALAADGINPHSTLSSRHSCWPVILVTYNLPPWMCMKKRFMMLTLLISGPKQPGNDIDVYLAPLIDDLKILWEQGITAYDAYRKETFTLKAVLLWTINDFPAYGNLSGQMVKGYKACPICSGDTYSTRLKHGRKICYTGHRRFLQKFHPYRKRTKTFNGKKEFDSAPKPLSGDQILSAVEGLSFSFGKGKKDSNNADSGKKIYWKKKSIFFELEYWKFLHIRHVLDVMHIEKNCCESIVGTLLNIPGKTKDSPSARLDHMNLRKELLPQKRGDKTYLPPACYTLSRLEKQKFCKTLWDLKVPEGYSSNLRNNISMEDLKLYGLKSHDCHTLMQQLLPLAIGSILPDHVRCAITRFCFFFNALCKKVIDVSKLDKIQSDLAVTLCMLEQYFPKAFFDIMIHLTVHLIREVKLCGPVYLRWMYPFERYMKELKGYVRNRNSPEGCIAEGYMAQEAMNFCTEYLTNMNACGISSTGSDYNKRIGKPLLGGRVHTIERIEWEQAHRTVLQNAEEVQPYIEQHIRALRAKNRIKSKNAKWLQDEHNKTFIDWFRERIANELTQTNSNVSETLKWLAHGPQFEVIKYFGYDINGRRYSTKAKDALRVHQNSGVTLVANTMQIASSKDKKPTIQDMTFYGVIQEIWDLDYNSFRESVFKCDWVESSGGITYDDFGMTLVDLNRIGHKSDPFILASQAKQVFYVAYQKDPRLSTVIELPLKDYDILDEEPEETIIGHECLSNLMPDIPDEMDENGINYVRTDCGGTYIDNKGTYIDDTI